MNAVNLKCTNDGHNLDVIGLCFSPQCTQESKLCCGKCFTGSHLKCLSDNSIMIIEDLINENYDDIIKITPFNFGINALSSDNPAESVPSPPLAQQYLLTGLNVAPVQLLLDAHIDIHSSLVLAAPSFIP